MTYREVANRLGIGQVCYGGCGLSDHAHRGSIFLSVIHWKDRRLDRRGLRKFLLLAAKRDRLDDTDYLNDAGLYALHFYLDEQRANAWADELGYRFPIRYSLPERRTVADALLRHHLTHEHQAIWAWARRAA